MGYGGVQVRVRHAHWQTFLDPFALGVAAQSTHLLGLGGAGAPGLDAEGAVRGELVEQGRVRAVEGVWRVGEDAEVAEGPRSACRGRAIRERRPWSRAVSPRGVGSDGDDRSRRMTGSPRSREALR